MLFGRFFRNILPINRLPMGESVLGVLFVAPLFLWGNNPIVGMMKEFILQRVNSFWYGSVYDASLIV